MFLLTSCHKGDDQLEQIYRLAGDNRPELEETLARYAQNPGDSLKYRAADFLIRNMAHGYRNESDQFVYDATVVSSDYLIGHIEKAFEAWRSSPWVDEIDFETFRHHILPYRVKAEPLSDWRDSLRTKYLPLIDNVDNPTEAFMNVYDRVTSDFKQRNSDNSHPIDVLQANRLMEGECDDRSAMLVCIMRALAIPSVYDHTPFWANYSTVGHSWVSHIRNDSTFSYLRKSRNPEFKGVIDASRFRQANPHYRTEELPFQVDSVKKPGIVFRACFEIQPERLALRKSREQVPDLFLGLFQKDVSGQYDFPGSYRLDTRHRGYVYLCIFKTGQGWTPASMADASGGKALFENLNQNVVYLPCTWHEGELIPLEQPFCITAGNEIRRFAPRTGSEAVRLRRKYVVMLHATEWAGKFIGGRFEGSNTANFSTKETLYEIIDIPMSVEKITFSRAKKYRYIRYVAPADMASDFAEVKFLGSSPADSMNIRELTGQLIGEGIVDLPLTISRAMDDDLSTYFLTRVSRRTLETGYWFGYDLGADNSYLFTGVEYASGSDLNRVEPGDRYELLFYDEKWISLGEKTATDYELEYSDVPEGALLWLRDLTEGNEERIFTYENGKQIWW